MCCKVCNGSSRVVDTVKLNELHHIYRLRNCLSCGHSWVTIEVPDPMNIPDFNFMAGWQRRNQAKAHKGQPTTTFREYKLEQASKPPKEAKPPAKRAMTTAETRNRITLERMQKYMKGSANVEAPTGK